MDAAQREVDLRAFPLNLSSRIMAGIDLGVRGAMLVLLWFCLHSLLIREFWWAKLNVLGSFFYGLSAFNSGLSRVTLAGVAILIVLYGLAGAIFSSLIGTRPKISFRTAITFVFGLLWHFAMTMLLLPWISPFSAGYLPPRIVFIGNLLFVLVLLRLGSRFRKLTALQERSSSRPPTEWQPATPAETGVVKPNPSPDPEEIWSSGSQPPQSGS